MFNRSAGEITPQPCFDLGNPTSLDVSYKRSFTSFGVREGSLESNSARTPLTNGVAIEVPLLAIYPEGVGLHEIMLEPGAITSGLQIHEEVGPTPE